MSELMRLTEEIRSGLNQVSSSNKDELRYMRTMLNDREYRADQYKQGELVGQICPSDEARQLLATGIAATTKIGHEEAMGLANEHEFKNQEAMNMINVAKSFVTGYVETGRKLPLGGKMDVAISQKHVEEAVRPYPKRIGYDEAGKAIYGKGEAPVPAHDTLKVHSPKLK